MISKDFTKAFHMIAPPKIDLEEMYFWITTSIHRLDEESNRDLNLAFNALEKRNVFRPHTPL